MTIKSLIDIRPLENLDFQPPCEAVFVLILFGVVTSGESKPCGKAAEYIADVHQYQTHTNRQKFLCPKCVDEMAPEGCIDSDCDEMIIQSLQHIKGKS